MIVKPAISIVGIQKGAESEALIASIPNDFDRSLFLGILVSSKTIHGIPNKHPGSYPRMEDLSDICRYDPRVRYIFHFNTSDKDVSRVSDDISRLIDRIEPRVPIGVQLNMVWPDVHIVTRIALNSRRVGLILQVSKPSLVPVDFAPEALADRVNGLYGCLFDYVLLDMSGGNGKPLRWELLRPYVLPLEEVAGVRVMVAGGIGVETLGLVAPALLEFPDIGIDAAFDIKKSVHFLRQAHDLCKKAARPTG